MITEQVLPKKYLTEKWRKRRSEILARDGFTCQWCGHQGGDNNHLQVHHRQYITVWNGGIGVQKEPWDYQDLYLVTLCTNCHKEGHKHYKIPNYDV